MLLSSRSVVTYAVLKVRRMRVGWEFLAAAHRIGHSHLDLHLGICKDMLRMSWADGH